MFAITQILLVAWTYCAGFFKMSLLLRWGKAEELPCGNWKSWFLALFKKEKNPPFPGSELFNGKKKKTPQKSAIGSFYLWLQLHQNYFYSVSSQAPRVKGTPNATFPRIHIHCLKVFLSVGIWTSCTPKSSSSFESRTLQKFYFILGGRGE